MAINKSNSPVWVKVTLIVLIVAFVLSFITIVANPFAPSQPQTQSGTATNGAAQGVDAQYQPQVDSLTTQLQADPKNYAALVSLGNAYFDWAIAKEQASQGTTTSAGRARAAVARGEGRVLACPRGQGRRVAGPR